MDGANDAVPDNLIVGLIRRTGIFTINIPKQIVLGDMRWGALDKFLQWSVAFFLIYSMATSHSYEQLLPATGMLQESYWTRTDFVRIMQIAEYMPYCTQPYSFDYSYCNHSQASGGNNEFWCEDNISCDPVDPAMAMVKQTPRDIWVYTYAKRRTARLVDCSVGASSCGNGELFENLGQRCQCVRTRNSFIPGAEGATYSFKHAAKMDARPDKVFRNMETVVKADKIDPMTGLVTGEQVVLSTIQAGATDYINLNIKTLIEECGLGKLDEADPVIQSDYPSATGIPSYRITGIQFDVRVIYSGSLWDATRPPKATVHIQPNLGWHSRGELVYQDDEEFLPGPLGAAQQNTSHDTYSVYPRGVHLKISFSGSFGEFDGLYIVSQLATLVVYLGVAGLITRYMVLWLLGYTSRVYRESVKEVITVDNVHAKKASQAIISAVTFAKLRADAAARADETKTGGAYFRQTVLEELKNAGLDDIEARGIAQVVAPYGAIEFNKFVDRAATLSSLGVKDVADFVVKAESKKLGAEAVPTLQPTVPSVGV